MSKSNERPLEPMPPAEAGFLEYVAMDSEMTGAIPTATEWGREEEEKMFRELYGMPEEENQRNYR